MPKKKATKKYARPGQPTKYKPEYCQVLIDTMKEGASLTSVACKLDVDRQTLYNWMGKHKEFFDAHKKGMDLCRGWWETLLRATATGKVKGNLGAQVFWMKNRFRDDWKDKIDHSWSEETDDIEMDTESLINIAKS